MKKLFFILTFVSIAAWAGAQDSVNQEEVRKATEEQVALYSLSETQAVEMEKIQARKFRNLAEIEVLRDSDYKQYVIRKSAIRKGINGSIDRLLTDDQRPVFNEIQLERRKKESEMIKSMRASGASKEDIQLAILALD